MPTTATVNRQPNGVSPNVHWPNAIMILPSGGCATISPTRWPLVTWKMFVLPATSRLFTVLRWFTSTPCFRIEYVSGT